MADPWVPRRGKEKKIALAVIDACGKAGISEDDHQFGVYLIVCFLRCRKREEFKTSASFVFEALQLFDVPADAFGGTDNPYAKFCRPFASD